MLDQFTPARPLWVVGCGNMGGALLEGWLKAGLAADAVVAVARRFAGDAVPPGGVVGVGSVDAIPGDAPRAVVLGVKPYQLEEVAEQIVGRLAPDSLIYSVLGGPTLARYHAAFGDNAQVVRAMPNTPVSVSAGVTGLVAAASLSTDNKTLANTLAASVGQAVWLDEEDQMDALSAVAGSGPAFVFHFTEALAAAARQAGLSEAQAETLARATVSGAGRLLEASVGQSPASLREAVTSPGGSTAAGLAAQKLGDGDDPQSMMAMMARTIAASMARSKEMAQE